MGGREHETSRVAFYNIRPKIERSATSYQSWSPLSYPCTPTPADLSACGRCPVRLWLSTEDHDHPHSLKPHTWHFMHPSANSSWDPQSGHAPESICCIPPKIICSPRAVPWDTGCDTTGATSGCPACGSSSC